MKQTLNLVHQESDSFQSNTQIEVEFELVQSDLIIKFYVQNELSVTNEMLSKNESAWGLWETDVVEAFLAVIPKNFTTCKTYYEFNLSPLNQYFECEIIEPRVLMNKNYRSKFEHNVQHLDSKNWIAQMKISLKSIGATDEMLQNNDFLIVGNAFACLGAQNSRTYWSLFGPKQAKPDFHIPKNFKKLI